MAYLFDVKINKLMENSSDPALEKFNFQCMEKTGYLLQNCHRGNLAYLINDAIAGALVISMGSRSRKDRGNVLPNAPHAADYVKDNKWTVVSSNSQHIVGLVAAERPNAYLIGLDIQNPEVVGNMYKLAVGYFSLAEYIGYNQNEGRR